MCCALLRSSIVLCLSPGVLPCLCRYLTYPLAIPPPTTDDPEAINQRDQLCSSVNPWLFKPC